MAKRERTWRDDHESNITRVLLRAARPLYAVADGRKTRSMIDALRDALFSFNDWPLPQSLHYQTWRAAIETLDDVTDSAGRIGGFQVWEVTDGRTVEECRAAFDRAIELALDWRH